MNRAIKLTLSSPIYYRSTPLTLEELQRKADRSMPGYDAAVLYSYSYEGEILSLRRLEAGERDGYTDEEKRIIESGGTVRRKDDEDFMIPEGSYLFEQLPFLPPESGLQRLILPYATGMSGRVFVRIYRESILESVMQLLFPME